MYALFDLALRNYSIIVVSKYFFHVYYIIYEIKVRKFVKQIGALVMFLYFMQAYIN